MPAPGSSSLSNKDVAQLVKEAKAGKARRVYLFAGESFDTRTAAQALIDELVPESKRAFNLETYDGRTTPILTVLDSLRTPGFFAGSKVIWVREAPLFMSGDKRGDLTEALFADWDAGREAQAAEKMLTLVALAGWAQTQLDEASWASASDARIREVFGKVVEAEQRQVLEAVRTAAKVRDLRVTEYHDESAALLAFLESEAASSAVLLFTSSTVDGRKKLVKRIQELGSYVSLAVERERSGALARQSVDDLIRRFAQERGKRVEAAAHEQIVRRAGADAANLANELEKLCLYVGDAAQIGEDDVVASFRDLAESWIFDFTRTLSQGQAGAALALLRGLFAQGEPPLRLLALIARELRMLLVARDCLGESLRGSWTPRVPFAQFRDRLLPSLSDEEREAFAGAHPFAIYLALQNAARASVRGLQRALLDLHEIDVALKSTRADPQLRLEAFVLTLCAAFRGK